MKEIKIEIGETKRTIKDIIIIQNIVEIEIETGIEEVEVEAEAEAGIEVEVEVEINPEVLDVQALIVVNQKEGLNILNLVNNTI